MRSDQARDAPGIFPCNAVCAVYSCSSRDVEIQPWFDSHQKVLNKTPRSQLCAEKSIAWEYLQGDYCSCVSLLHIQLLMIIPQNGNIFKGAQRQKIKESKQRLNTIRPKKNKETFGRIFLNFLWWLWDCTCGWTWSISPEEIHSQPVICKAMSVCRVFFCAQDSKGLQVPARTREDCASIFWIVLLLSLSVQQWWPSPLILWG